MEDIISLDSSVLINHYRTKNKQLSFFYSLVQKYNSFIISVITEYEILIGSKQPLQIEFWKNVFTDFFIADYTSQINAIAIDISLHILPKGIQIEFKDLIIAATALHKKVPLATLNEKDFTNISGLSLITPSSL